MDVWGDHGREPDGEGHLRVTFIIPDETTASLWLPTASLPVSHPYGIAANTFGTKLYVTCLGADPASGTGALVEIDVATKVATTVASGYTWMKHGVGVDSSGNVYFTAGANNSQTAYPMYKWDGSSVSALPADGNRIEPNGIEVFNDELYYGYRDVGGSDLRDQIMQASLDGSSPVLLTSHDQFSQVRGIGVTSGYVVSADSGTGSTLRITNISAGTTAVINGDDPIGVWGQADDECYVTYKAGQVLRRVNPSTATATTITVTGGTVWSDIVITSGSRAFAVAGGVTTFATTRAADQLSGTDSGIYEIRTTGGGPWVGFIGVN